MARAKKSVESEAAPVEAAPGTMLVTQTGLDYKLAAVAEMIEAIVSGQYAPVLLKQKARELSITLKG